MSLKLSKAIRLVVVGVGVVAGCFAVSPAHADPVPTDDGIGAHILPPWNGSGDGGENSKSFDAKLLPTWEGSGPVTYAAKTSALPVPLVDAVLEESPLDLPTADENKSDHRGAGRGVAANAGSGNSNR
ncbi:MAG: hypothetical protein HOQ05_06020 [Corynebacteriales bacterium]|nr:hypothetical protein [Mycobacteriales bacterium]